MILHTVNKSPHSSHCLADCLTRVSAGDSVILIEDGVYAISATHSKSLSHLNEQMLSLVDSEVQFYALLPDIEARGLLTVFESSYFKLLDDDSFVDLVTEVDKVLSWF